MNLVRREALLKQPVAYLQDFLPDGVDPVRPLNMLGEVGVKTIGDLLQCCPNVDCRCNRVHLMQISNFGTKTLEHFQYALRKLEF